MVLCRCHTRRMVVLRRPFLSTAQRTVTGRGCAAAFLSDVTPDVVTPDRFTSPVSTRGNRLLK